MCPNSECNFRKQVNFTPRHFQLEGTGFEIKVIKNFLKGLKKQVKRFFQPMLNVTAPFIRMAFGSRSKNAKVGPAKLLI